jgi:hypothetical protein
MKNRCRRCSFNHGLVILVASPWFNLQNTYLEIYVPIKLGIFLFFLNGTIIIKKDLTSRKSQVLRCVSICVQMSRTVCYVQYVTHNELFDNFLTTFWQLFDNLLTTFDNFLTTFLTTFWQFIFLLFDTMWHYNTFVTSQVLIRPSNDGRRHGRGTYLLLLVVTFCHFGLIILLNKRHFWKGRGHNFFGWKGGGPP